MKQLVGDYEVLESDFLMAQVGGKGNGPGRRAGAPLAGHVSDSDARCGDVEALRPVLDALPEGFVPVVTCRTRTDFRASFHARQVRAPGFSRQWALKRQITAMLRDNTELYRKYTPACPDTRPR